MNSAVIPLKKKRKLAIGLMSGTSLDSIDAALVEITGLQSIKVLDYISRPFPEGLKDTLLKNSNPDSGNVTDICRLNFLLSYIYSDAVKALLKKNKLKSSEIDFIGSHGQTIHHMPEKKDYFGYSFGSTLQIGDPSVIAKLTGILTVGDFRTGDMALGGEGAPLIPYFDYSILRSTHKNRALINIGGISNVTYIKKKSRLENLIAFDTGPGNMLIDLLCRHFYDFEFDRGGKIAASGKVKKILLDKIIESDSFVIKEPPKSTGREYYGEIFLEKVLFNDGSFEYSDLKKEDVVSTFTEFTAYAIHKNFELHIKEFPDEIYLSGGGARNNFLVKMLKQYFGTKTRVLKLESIGISSDAKEAVCFAYLANETLSYRPSNVPNVTGASKPTILGKICLP